MVVVTGASGHVGANLVRALVARGDRVRAVVHRDDRALAGLPVERVRADVCDAASLRAVFDGADVAYHAAAVISIDGDPGGRVHATNVTGAENAARAALDTGVRRFVHFCSVHAFVQQPAHAPLDEGRERVPAMGGGHPAYDRSKAEGERRVREAMEDGLDAVILHPTGIIGPEDHGPSRMGRFFLALHDRTLPSLVGGGFDWVDVRDVVSSALVAADRGVSGQSYLLAGRWASMRELSALSAEVAGVVPPRLSAPRWVARAGAPFVGAWSRLTGSDPLYTGESIRALGAARRVVDEAARGDLGHAPRPLEESVRDVYAWFRETGRLGTIGSGSALP